MAIGDWLKAEGWDDLFLDLDAVQGIAPGERWERALYERASDCEAVLFLVSANWLASDWCRREYELARRLNKRAFIILIDDIEIEALPVFLKDAHQAVRLGAGTDHIVFHPKMPVTHEEGHITFSAEGLARLKSGLARAGLDPKFFLWPPADEPNRAPYPGLRALEASDAGVFFGRDAPIVEGMDRMRALAQGAPPRILVLLGASGSGKSSFLRAGLLPRLKRDDANFVTLPPLRPGRTPLTGEHGLAGVLTVVFPNEAKGALRSLATGDVETLRSRLRELVEEPQIRAVKAGAELRRPAIVITVDQAEELFVGDGQSEAGDLLARLAGLAREDQPPTILIFCIRSDAYDHLQRAPALAGFSQVPMSLSPLPKGSYASVIEGPAKRVEAAGGKLTIEPVLVERLLEDIDRGAGSDALPVLAFTLELLWSDFHRSGRLRLQDYLEVGGLGGAIDKAVERALARADLDPRIPRERGAREALLRRGLIPWLAGIDPDLRSPRRAIARRADIPPESEPLIQLLVEERLLTAGARDVGDPAMGRRVREPTIEPTHEALLRQWGLLKGWLDEDFGLLSALEGVKRATRDWDANKRQDSWLAHRGARLAEACACMERKDIAAKLDKADTDYLARCGEREAELARRDAQRGALRRALVGVVAAATVAAVLAFIQYRAAQTAADNEQIALALQRSGALLADGRNAEAAREALQAYKSEANAATRSALFTAALEISPHLDRWINPRQRVLAMAWPNRNAIALAGEDNRLRIVRLNGDGRSAVEVGDAFARRMSAEEESITYVSQLMALESGAIVAALNNGAVNVFDAHGKLLADTRVPLNDYTITVRFGRVSGASFSIFYEVGGRALSVACSFDAVKKALWCAEPRLSRLKRVIDLAPEPGGDRLAIVQAGENATVPEAIVTLRDRDDASVGQPVRLKGRATHARLAQGGRLLALTLDGVEQIIDLSGGRMIGSLGAVGTTGAQYNNWRPDRSDLLVGCNGFDLCLQHVDATADSAVARPTAERFEGHRAPVAQIAWAPDGAMFAMIDSSGRMGLWHIAQSREVASRFLPATDHTRWTSLVQVPGTNAFTIAATDSPQIGLIAAGTAEPPKLAAAADRVVSLAASPRRIYAALPGTIGYFERDGAELGPFTPLADLDFSAKRMVWIGRGEELELLDENGRFATLDAGAPGARPRYVAIPEYIAVPEKEEETGFGLVFDSARQQALLSLTHGRVATIDLATRRWTGALDDSNIIAASDRWSSSTLSVRRDGEFVAVAGKGPNVLVFDLVRRVGWRKLPAQHGDIVVAQFDSSGRKIAALDADRRLTVWRIDRNDTRLLLAVPAFASRVQRSLETIGAMQPSILEWLDDERIVVGGGDAPLQIIDLQEDRWIARVNSIGETAK